MSCKCCEKVGPGYFKVPEPEIDVQALALQLTGHPVVTHDRCRELANQADQRGYERGIREAAKLAEQNALAGCWRPYSREPHRGGHRLESPNPYPPTERKD